MKSPPVWGHGVRKVSQSLNPCWKYWLPPFCLFLSFHSIPYPFHTHCNRVWEIQHHKNANEQHATKTPSLSRLCFNTVLIYSITLLSEKKCSRLHASFAPLLGVSTHRHVMWVSVYLTLNFTFAAAYSLFAMALSHPYVVWYGKKRLQKYHQVDRAFKLAGTAILPNYKYVGPWSYVGMALYLLATN